MATHQAYLDRLLFTQQEKGYKKIWLYYKLRDQFPLESNDPYTVDDLAYLQQVATFDGGKVGQVMQAGATADLRLELNDRYYLWNFIASHIETDEPDLADAMNAAYPLGVFLTFGDGEAEIAVFACIVINPKFNLTWIQEDLTERLHKALQALYGLQAVPTVIFEAAGDTSGIETWLGTFHQWEEWTVLETALQTPEVELSKLIPRPKIELQRQLSLL